MQRFKNILVVVSDQVELHNDPAIERGAALAAQNDGRLTLLDVLSPVDSIVSEYEGIDRQRLGELMIEQRRSEMKKIMSKLQEQQIYVDSELVSGRGFIEIIRKVVRDQHDIVIKSAEKNEFSFGSSDFHLMRKCPCPVWIMKPKNKNQCKKILASVDLAMEKEVEGRELNRLIMDLATSLTRWENSELHLLSCWILYGESTLRHSAFLKVPEKEIDALLNAEEATQQKHQDNFCGDYIHTKFERHLIKGDPKIEIPEFVQENGIDTVVMGTVGRTGIPGFFIGNTAETVLRAIDASVITVKPRNFKSPVE